MAKVAAEFEGKVTFVGIAGRGPLGDMQAFVSETGTGGFTHVADVDGSLWSRFGVVAQPSFVFVTPSGEPQSFTGGLGEKDLRDVANQLLPADQCRWTPGSWRWPSSRARSPRSTPAASPCCRPT